MSPGERSVICEAGLAKIKAASLEWATVNGGQVSSIRTVPTTIDVAARALQGDRVSAGDFPIYLTIISGQFRIGVSAERPSGRSGVWAALFISRESFEVMVTIMRPTNYDQGVNYSELDGFTEISLI
jgi:hypothetical protein